jgi:hypothetical protein
LEPLIKTKTYRTNYKGEIRSRELSMQHKQMLKGLIDEEKSKQSWTRQGLAVQEEDDERQTKGAGDSRRKLYDTAEESASDKKETGQPKTARSIAKSLQQTEQEIEEMRDLADEIIMPGTAARAYKLKDDADDEDTSKVPQKRLFRSVTVNDDRRQRLMSVHSSIVQPLQPVICSNCSK